MRQFADGTTSASDIRTAPMTVTMTPNSLVCLPLVSESKKLIWVRSDQIDLQLNGAAELDKAFDRFPYLTHKQTAALAQRCSLHPDQVRVWFMTQRLRYGISWDYNDIREVWSKFKSSQRGAAGPEELENGMEGDKKKKKKENMIECGGKKAGDEQKSAKEGKIIGQNVTVTEQLEELLMKKEVHRSVEEDKTDAPKKRKKMAVMDKMGKKKKKHGNEGITERATKVEAKSEKDKGQKCIKSEGKKSEKKRPIFIQPKPAINSDVVSGVPLGADSLLFLQPQTQTFNAVPLADNKVDLLVRADVPCSSPDVPCSSPDVLMTPVSGCFQGKPQVLSELLGDLLINATNHSVLVTDVMKFKELTEANNSLLVGDDQPTVARQQSYGGEDAPPRRSRFNTKTHSQMTMLRMAFLRCQYPDSEHYRRLAAVIGVPRHVLVQWYGDMRYYIKRSMPRWMNKEQHRHVLASVRYRQYMSRLAKEQQRPSSGSGAG